MLSRNIKMTIAYDGTDFAGWQIQEKHRTVQGVLSAALAKLHKHHVVVTGAGRTDSGVHANGQVVNFFSDIPSIPACKFKDALNCFLPDDVSILESGEVMPDFNARFSARRRVYRYYYYVSPVFIPHINRYAVRISRFPDIHIINSMAAMLIGYHDFSTFAAAGDKCLSKFKNIYSAVFYMEGQFLIFKIEADSFLYRMVRSIVGTIMECYNSNWPIDAFYDILTSKERLNALTTAPSSGLFLEKVYYGNEPDYIR